MAILNFILTSSLLMFACLPATGEVREAQFLSGAQLHSDESFDRSAIHACQPSVGDRALIINIAAKIEALKGLNAAKVKITSGKCKGETGWVAIAHLNALV